MEIKKILCGFLGLISMGLLSGCSDNSFFTKNSTSTNNSDNTQTGEINIIKNDKLAVDQSKCVGCGKCVRIAPANLEMNSTTHKAQVKSNEISNQANVDRAVSACHVNAISQ